MIVHRPLKVFAIYHYQSEGIPLREMWSLGTLGVGPGWLGTVALFRRRRRRRLPTLDPFSIVFLNCPQEQKKKKQRTVHLTPTASTKLVSIWTHTDPYGCPSDPYGSIRDVRPTHKHPYR